MEYGILIAVSDDGDFQVIGAVDSPVEARLIADEYIKHGPESGYLAPWEFQIHRRAMYGAYTNIEHLEIL